MHRLDKDSSGLLLIAKTAEVFFELQRQFKEKKITKIYKALVHGDLKGEGVINVPVGRLPWNRRRFGVLADGREAVTEYKAIEEFRTNTESYTLLEVKPATGRTHQIRVHLKHLGYSLVGDSLYSGNKTLAMDRQFCPRLFLHASVLGFRHPIKNNHVVITSDFPQELRKVIAFVSKSVKST